MEWLVWWVVDPVRRGAVRGQVVGPDALHREPADVQLGARQVQLRHQGRPQGRQRGGRRGVICS